MTSYCPVPGPVPTSPANRDYKAGFTAAMMLKDLRLAQEAGARDPRHHATRRRRGGDLRTVRRRRCRKCRFFRDHPFLALFSISWPATRLRKRKNTIDKTAERIVAIDRDGTAGSRKHQPLSALWKF
jgi:hypothetical protein